MGDDIMEGLGRALDEARALEEEERRAEVLLAIRSADQAWRERRLENNRRAGVHRAGGLGMTPSLRKRIADGLLRGMGTRVRRKA